VAVQANERAKREWLQGVRRRSVAAVEKDTTYAGASSVLPLV
jgi:hypothetical protein